MLQADVVVLAVHVELVAPMTPKSPLTGLALLLVQPEQFLVLLEPLVLAVPVVETLVQTSPLWVVPDSLKVIPLRRPPLMRLAQLAATKAPLTSS